jgi:CheY-like chemotaxis protein
MAPYRIVLADNHAPLREGLKRILDEQSDLEIAGEAGEGAELFDLLTSGLVTPHMVILGSSLPNLQGTEAIRKVRAIHPGTKVLMLSMHEDVEYLSQALSAGAEGYLIKESVDKELLQAIKTIRQGRIYVPEALAGSMPAWHPVNPSGGRRIMPSNYLTFNGKKFMWDGVESAPKETILDSMQKYKKEGFEVELYEEDQKIYLYTRRVVKEVAAQGS